MYVPDDGKDALWLQPERKPENEIRESQFSQYAVDARNELNKQLKEILAKTEKLQLDDFSPGQLKDAPHNKTLPIFRHRETIIRAIASNVVTIISGDTGCGKVKCL